jgi:hypothetical protein
MLLQRVGTAVQWLGRVSCGFLGPVSVKRYMFMYQPNSRDARALGAHVSHDSPSSLSTLTAACYNLLFYYSQKLLHDMHDAAS